MIIYLSDSSNKHHGDCLEWPYIIVGGCSGKLNIPGRYIRYPKYGDKGCRTIGDWWTTPMATQSNTMVTKISSSSRVGCLMPGPLQNLSHDPICRAFRIFSLHQAIRCNLTNYDGKSDKIVAQFESRNGPAPFGFTLTHNFFLIRK